MNSNEISVYLKKGRSELSLLYNFIQQSTALSYFLPFKLVSLSACWSEECNNAVFDPIAPHPRVAIGWIYLLNLKSTDALKCLEPDQPQFGGHHGTGWFYLGSGGWSCKVRKVNSCCRTYVSAWTVTLVNRCSMRSPIFQKKTSKKWSQRRWNRLTMSSLLREYLTRGWGFSSVQTWRVIFGLGSVIKDN